MFSEYLGEVDPLDLQPLLGDTFELTKLFVERIKVVETENLPASWGLVAVTINFTMFA